MYSELPRVADKAFAVGFLRRGDDDEGARVVAVDDFLHDRELLPVDGAGEGEAFFATEATDTFIESGAAVHGFHDFTRDFFVFRGVDRDQTAAVQSIEKGIHRLGGADDGDDAVQCGFDLTENQHGGRDDHEIHQHDGIAGLHVWKALLKKLREDIATAARRVPHEDQRQADAHEDAAEGAGYEAIALVLPWTERRHEVLDHTHEDDRADGLQCHTAIQQQPGRQQQWNVDGEAECTDRQAEQMVDHQCDTRDPTRRDPARLDEAPDTDGLQQRTREIPQDIEPGFSPLLLIFH